MGLEPVGGKSEIKTASAKPLDRPGATLKSAIRGPFFYIIMISAFFIGFLNNPIYVSVPSQSHWQDEDPWPFVKWRPGSKGLFGPGDACREPSMRGWGAGPPGTAVTDTDTDTPGRGPPAAVCRPGTLTEGESVGDGGGGGKGEAPAGAAGL